MTSYDHHIEGSCQSMEGAHSSICQPDKSCDHWHFDNRNMFLICNMASHEHMFKGLYEFMGGRPSHGRVSALPCFVAIGPVQVEIWSI